MKIVAEYALQLGYGPFGEALEARTKSYSLSSPETAFDQTLVFYTRTVNIIPLDDFFDIIGKYMDNPVPSK